MSKNDIVSVVESGSSLYKGKGVSETEITKAEIELKVSFADDFRAFLVHYGYAMINGHEILGLGESPDVVEATKAERTKGHDIDDGWYVVEELNIDGIVVWQEASGAIYQTVASARRVPVARNLSEYLTAGELGERGGRLNRVPLTKGARHG